MTWVDYLARISGDDQQKTIAERTGVDPATVSRWRSTGQPGRVENVAAFARGYRRPVLEAFVAAGFLTAAEAKERPTATPSLKSLTVDQLVDEVRRRMREAGDDGGDTAATNEPGSGLDSVVHPMKTAGDMAQMQTKAATSIDE